MSYVTNLILHVGLSDEELILAVNSFFSDKDTGFVSVDDKSLPSGWYGGTKTLETCFAVGAFNHLDIDALLEHIRSITWLHPESVQLIVRCQEDHKCKLIDVFP